MTHGKWTLWLVLSAFCMAAAPEGKSPLGMVIQVSGETILQRGTEKKNAQLADLIFPADRLAVNSGDVGIIFCPSTERITFKKGAIAEFSAAQVRIVKGPPPTKERDKKCSLPQVSLGSESMERIGGLRARGYPPVALHLGGAVSTSRPVFRWAAVTGASRYNVTLRDQNGTSIWKVSTEAAELPYPDSEPALAEKDYSWEVWAERDTRTVAQSSANFHIKISSPAGDPPRQMADKLLRAVELENAGYFAEAAHYFRELREANPSDTRITNHLVWLYSNAGLSAAMNEELARLDAKK